MTPDEIPLWFAVPAAIILWGMCLAPLFRPIPEDPEPETSYTG